MPFNAQESHNSIAVMICTRKRPKMLEACLLSVIHQIEKSDQDDFILVIENDTEDESRAIVEALQSAYCSIPIYYVQEKELGIPIARQTGVDFALSLKPDWLAFLDDDEELEDGWLEAMRRAAVDFDCEVLTGPVRYIYPDTVPDWFEVPGFKNRPRAKESKKAATNNTLLRASWYAAQRGVLRFDPQFRFTGGSDTDFFYSLTDLGGRIKWVDDAIVREIVPDSRLTEEWQLQRARRTAANAMQIARKRRGNLYALRRCGIKSLGRFLRGILALVSSFGLKVFSDQKSTYLRFEGKKALASSLGYWDGFLGTAPQPYLKTTGS